MPPRIELPPQFAELLDGLRRRIRAYVLVEGTARIVCLLGLLFWFTLSLDWLWFRVSRLELPVWFRSFAVLAAITMIGAGLVVWIALRFLPGLRARALALVLERRFPELDDRLITAVEMAEAPLPESPLTQAMLQRTVNDAARLVPNLQIGNVFEKRTLQRAVAFAGVLVASIIGLGVANADAMDRWYKAYVLRLDHYWHRDTELVARVLVPPGDTLRPFREHRYKHAKGTDLTLVVDLAEGQRPDGGEWKAPDYVTLSYSLDNGRGGGSVTMSRFGDRQFRHTFGGLLDGMRFWISGNDFTNRIAYRVDVVDPPQIAQLVLDSEFPAHTGMNDAATEAGKPAPRKEVRVQGTQVSIPVETRFVLRGEINKPLLNARIEFGRNRLSFGFFRPPQSLQAESAEAAPVTETFKAEWTIESEDRLSQERKPLDEAVARRFLSEDRMRFQVPMALSAQETDAARDRSMQPMSDFGLPFVLPPDTPVRIYLEDTDDILTIDPARLTINGTPDQPPLVQTELQGIGTSITRKALIPLTGMVTDDFGLYEVQFEYRIDDSPEWTPRPLRGQFPQDEHPKEFRLAISPENPREEFDVLQLELPVGKKLTLTVLAKDGDTLNGPHETRGEQFVFTIVSNEELLTILYGREVNLRQRFKQIMDEVDGTRKDLILHRAKYAEATELKKTGKNDEQKKIDELMTAVAVCAERTLHQIRKNTSETAVIEDSFRAMLEELVNNRVHTEQMVQRLNGLIVDPLHAINTIDYPTCDGAAGLYKLANEKGQDPTSQIDNTIESLSTMLEHMERVLKEMQELANFHEAIKELKVIIDDSEKLKGDTAREQKKKDIERLKGLTD